LLDLFLAHEGIGWGVLTCIELSLAGPLNASVLMVIIGGQFFEDLAASFALSILSLSTICIKLQLWTYSSEIASWLNA
jgi:hypothetical protein